MEVVCEYSLISARDKQVGEIHAGGARDLEDRTLMHVAISDTS